LDYVAGLYFFQEDYGINTAIDLGSQYCQVFVAAAGQGACNAGPHKNANSAACTQTEPSYAGYFQANYKLLDPLILTLGVRETSDDKTGTFNNVSLNPG